MSNDYVSRVKASFLFKELEKENEFYKSIIANNSFYIIKTDLEGRYTYLNPYFCKRLNVNPEKWVGKDSLALILPEDHKSCIDTVTACFAEPTVSHWVTLRKPVSNGIIFTRWEFRMLTDSMNLPSEILCIGHDITSLVIQQLHERTQLLTLQEETVRNINNDLKVLNNELEERVAIRTKALAKSESSFRNMMETIPQIAWTNTLEGRFTFYNQRWYDYTGLKENHADIWGWKSTIHPDDLKTTLDQFRQIRKNHTSGEFEARFKNAEGVYRWHLSRLMPISNKENQEELLWVGTATDIHELKLLQQQKDDFISIASHELKTPLTSMKISLQLLNELKEKPSHEMLPRLIEQANKNLNSMTLLVDNILNASNFNEGQFQLNLSSINIFRVIEDYCDNTPIKNSYNVILKGDEDTFIYADQAKIIQVITNLINNAIKYAPSSLTIEIIVENIRGGVKISVTDYGMGIAAEKQNHIFNRYYRIDSTIGHGSSLGLGLYICSEIIKKHHGEIGVTSVLERGSTFWFTLPIDPEIYQAEP